MIQVPQSMTGKIRRDSRVVFAAIVFANQKTSFVLAFVLAGIAIFFSADAHAWGGLGSAVGSKHCENVEGLKYLLCQFGFIIVGMGILFIVLVIVGRIVSTKSGAKILKWFMWGYGLFFLAALLGFFR